MTARIFLKIIAGVISVWVVALIAVDLLASRVAERTYVQSLPADAIRRLAEAAGGRLTRGPEAACWLIPKRSGKHGESRQPS